MQFFSPFSPNMSISDFPLNVAMFPLHSACRLAFLRKSSGFCLSTTPPLCLPSTISTFLMISPAAEYTMWCTYCLTHTLKRKSTLGRRRKTVYRNNRAISEIIIIKNLRRRRWCVKRVFIIILPRLRRRGSFFDRLCRC